VPVGFLAAVTRGLDGEALTEMHELREAGALGFTDDGRPVHRAGVLRSALQYQRLAGGVLALHEEDPSLSANGVMHEGAVSARLGLAGIPSVSESAPIARDALLARYEDGRIHVQHLSARESVEAVAAAKASGARISAEVTPHHLTLTDEVLLGELDTRRKMNPPLRSAADRAALVDALRDGTIDCIATDHAPHAREEKEVPFEEAPMGTTGLETASTPSSWSPACCRWPWSSSGSRPAPRSSGCPLRASRSAVRRTSASSTSRPSGRWARPATSRGRRTARSRARACAAASWPRWPRAGSPTGSARSR
jgi:dihydroorotase (multifunctional complex type)